MVVLMATVRMMMTVDDRELATVTDWISIPSPVGSWRVASLIIPDRSCRADGSDFLRKSK